MAWVAASATQEIQASGEGGPGRPPGRSPWRRKRPTDRAPGRRPTITSPGAFELMSTQSKAGGGGAAQARATHPRNNRAAADAELDDRPFPAAATGQCHPPTARMTMRGCHRARRRRSRSALAGFQVFELRRRCGDARCSSLSSRRRRNTAGIEDPPEIAISRRCPGQTAKSPHRRGPPSRPGRRGDQFHRGSLSRPVKRAGVEAEAKTPLQESGRSRRRSAGTGVRRDGGEGAHQPDQTLVQFRVGFPLVTTRMEARGGRSTHRHQFAK